MGSVWFVSNLLAVLLVIGLLGIVGGYAHQEPVSLAVIEYHEAHIESLSLVYDGDTVKDVHVKLAPLCGYETRRGELWPGVFYSDDGLYATFDLRISGIDTPEKRTSTKNRDGTRRSAKSRAAEKAASLRARDALKDLLSQNDMKFYVANPKHGKYAGRLVADMYIGESLINVADYMIETGHAKPYDGGRKPVWNF